MGRREKMMMKLKWERRENERIKRRPRWEKGYKNTKKAKKKKKILQRRERER